MSAIEIIREGAVATVLLNAPERMNAMNLEMFEGIGRAMAELDADHDLRCVMFRGPAARLSRLAPIFRNSPPSAAPVTRRLPMRRSQTRRWRRCRAAVIRRWR